MIFRHFLSHAYHQFLTYENGGELISFTTWALVWRGIGIVDAFIFGVMKYFSIISNIIFAEGPPPYFPPTVEEKVPPVQPGWTSQVGSESFFSFNNYLGCFFFFFVCLFIALFFFFPFVQQASSHNVVVVTQQPTPVITQSVHVTSGSDYYMTLSIILTVLCILSCSYFWLVLTIPAIFYASQVSQTARLTESIMCCVVCVFHTNYSLMVCIIANSLYTIILIIIYYNGYIIFIMVYNYNDLSSL